MSKEKRDTRVVRIPKEIYEKVLDTREELLEESEKKSNSELWALLAGIGIGGLIGYLIAKGLEKFNEERKK